MERHLSQLSLRERKLSAAPFVQAHGRERERYLRSGTGCVPVRAAPRLQRQVTELADLYQIDAELSGLGKQVKLWSPLRW